MRLRNQLYLAGEVEYATCDGRKIWFSSGEVPQLSYSFELSIHATDAEDDFLPTDVIEHRVWVPDANGQVWTASTRFFADVFVDQLAQTNFDNGKLLVYWDQAEPDIHQLFESHLLLDGVRYSSDDRFYRSLWIGGERVEFIFKYTCITFDIAAQIGSGPFAWTTLYAKLRNDSIWIEGDSLPAIALEMCRPEDLFRLNHAVYDEAEGEWELSPLPIPLFFELTDEMGEPQPNVMVV